MGHLFALLLVLSYYYLEEIYLTVKFYLIQLNFIIDSNFWQMSFLVAHP